MTHHWDPSDVLAEDLTGIWDIGAFGAGEAPVWDPVTETFVPGGGGGGGGGAGGSGSPLPFGALIENYSRYIPLANVGVLISGRESLTAISLPLGFTVTSITFVSGTTAAGAPLNQWFTLRDSSRNLLEVTVDDTNTAWPADTAKELDLATPFVTTYSGVHYIGMMVRATTVPTHIGVFSSVTPVHALPPILSGPDTVNTGLTTPATAPATSAAIVPSTNLPYLYVS